MPTRLLKRVKRWLRPPRPDARGRRFVAVIECILNQNARDDGAACSPAVDFQVLERCHAHRVGVLQMPLPGDSRARLRAPACTGRAHPRHALHNEACIERCATLAHEVAERIETYLAQGYELVAILGGNPETRAAPSSWERRFLCERSGLFMRQLQTEFANAAAIRASWPSATTPPNCTDSTSNHSNACLPSISRRQKAHDPAYHDHPRRR